jgi:hypothetical protein
MLLEDLVDAVQELVEAHARQPDVVGAHRDAVLGQHGVEHGRVDLAIDAARAEEEQLVVVAVLEGVRDLDRGCAPSSSSTIPGTRSSTWRTPVQASARTTQNTSTFPRERIIARGSSGVPSGGACGLEPQEHTRRVADGGAGRSAGLGRARCLRTLGAFMDGGMDAGGRWLRWAFVGPTLLFLVAFNVYPLAYNVVLGFTDAELVRRGWEWHGGASYARLFADPEFAEAVRRTGLFVLLAVALELALGFGAALALRGASAGATRCSRRCSSR